MLCEYRENSESEWHFREAVYALFCHFLIRKGTVETRLTSSTDT